MTRCPVCNTNLPDNSKFCLECGYSFSGGQTGQLNTDTILEHRYVIVKTLGRGGMGAVYLAFDQRLNNTPVAIKEMSTNAVGTGNLQAAIGAFKKEASILIGLRHPALPTVKDFFARGEDRWYLVMDYIQGETLKQLVDRRGPVPEAEVIDWARQLGDILFYLHNQNPPIIFRDLKPSNIILTPQGQIKLVDFGIARHFRQGVTADTSAYGSSGFAPPEQYGQAQTDARADIYALGATMHYLITGIDPINNPFQFEVPSKYVKVSPRLETAIIKALEIRIENRPNNMNEMMSLLPKGSFKPASRTIANAVIAPQKDEIQSHQAADKDIEKASAATKTDKIEKPLQVSPKANKQAEEIATTPLSTDNVATTALNSDLCKPEMNVTTDLQLQSKNINKSTNKTVPQLTGADAKNPTASTTVPIASFQPGKLNTKSQPANNMNKQNNNKKIWIVSGIIIFLLVGGISGYKYFNKNENNINVAQMTEPTDQQEESAAIINAITLANEIDLNTLAAASPSTSFLNSAPQIYAVVSLDRSIDDSINGRWYFISNGQKELVVDEFNEVTQSSDGQSFYMTLQADKYKVGDWQFEAYLDSGTTKTVQFTIAEAPTAEPIKDNNRTAGKNSSNTYKPNTGNTNTSIPIPTPNTTVETPSPQAPISESYDNRPATEYNY